MEKIRSIPYMIAIKKGSDATFFLCAHLGSNQGPTDYESVALTN